MSATCVALLADTAPALLDAIRDGVRASRRSDLTLPQLRCLGYLQRHDGASLAEVAEHVGLSSPAMSQVVDGLVTRKLLRRGVAQDDRRRVRLSSTAAGRAQLDDAREGARAELAKLVARMPSGDVAKLEEGLHALRVAMLLEVNAS